MPKYKVSLSGKAIKQLDKMNDVTAKPILAAIARLADEPRPNGYKDLKGRNGYRIRVGDYRIIYEVFDAVLLVDVVSIGNRKDVYD